MLCFKTSGKNGARLEPIKLLETSNSVKAAETVRIINEFIGVHEKMIYREQVQQIRKN